MRPPQHPLEQGGPTVWIVRQGVSEAPRDSAEVEPSLCALYARPSKSCFEVKITAASSLVQSNASETSEPALSSAAYGARQDCLSGFRKSLSSSPSASLQKASHDTHARKRVCRSHSAIHALATTAEFIAGSQGVLSSCPTTHTSFQQYKSHLRCLRLISQYKSPGALPLKRQRQLPEAPFPDDKLRGEDYKFSIQDVKMSLFPMASHFKLPEANRLS